MLRRVAKDDGPMDSQLLALEQIGKRRYEKAQTAVFVALSQKEDANKALAASQKALKDYQEQLPELVNALYVNVLGKLTDAPSIENLLQEELKLTKKVGELTQEVEKCQTTLDLCIAAVTKAYGQLQIQERKKTALGELRKELAKKHGIKAERSLAKIMDEFAGYRYISKHS